MPLFVAAGVLAAGSVASSYIGSQAAGKAADAQAAASAASIAEQRREFDLAQSNQRPWLVTGTSALNKLAGYYGLDTFAPNWTGSATGSNLVSSPVAGFGGTMAAPGGASGSSIPNTSGQIVSPAWDAGLLTKWFSHGRPYDEDIAAALQQGKTITPEQWAQAGLPNGGNDAFWAKYASIGLQQPGSGTSQPSGTYTPGSQQPGVDPYATFYQSPDYQFRFKEGLRGVDAGAAAGGSLDSGATRKAEIGYAGNLASGEWNDYANRLAALAGVGQTTATNLGNLGANYAQNVGNTLTNQGNNRASSYLAQGANYGSTISNLAGIGSGLIQNNPQWFGGGGSSPITSGFGGYVSGGGQLPDVFVTPGLF